MASPRHRWLPALAFALPLLGCADETVWVPTCDDGVLDAGELCLGGALFWCHVVLCLRDKKQA